MKSIPRRIKPKPYLDTNVILDYIRKRKRSSEILLDTIKNRKIKCWTSYHGILEVINKTLEDKWIEKRHKEYRETFDEIYRNRNSRQLTTTEAVQVNTFLKREFLTPFIDANIVNMVEPASNDWKNIIDLVSNKNYSIMDAIHVDSALGGSCNIFISNDEPLRKLIQKDNLIPVASTEEIETILIENGIRSIIPFHK